MRRKWLRRSLIALFILIVLAGAAAWFGLVPLPGQQLTRFPEGELPPQPLQETVPIARAADVIRDLQVGGKLALRTVQEIKAPFRETIAGVNIEAGARVAAGALLVQLDRQELAAQLDDSWFELTKSRVALADLVQPVSATELLEARAALIAAHDELVKLEDGPSATDINSAALAIQEAQTTYDELLARNDPNSSEVRNARYALRQAQNALQQAQTAYDAVSWRGDIGALAEASALQSATISYESAQTAYDDAIKPPTDLERQQAQLAITRAQNEYTKLFEAATRGQIEQARANVANAEKRVADLLRGASNTEIQDAERAVLDALTNLEETRLKLLRGSDLIAPFDSVVTKLAATVGQVVEEGDTVVTVAAPDQFEIVLSINENSILRLSEGMEVAITVDVAPDVLLQGTVTHIGTIDTDSLNRSGTDTGSAPGASQPVNYPVTVAVDDNSVTPAVRAGMSVQVTFVGSSQLPENSWLVPANGVENGGARGEQEFGTIQVLRDGVPEPLEVELTGQTQGEWVVVVSSDLQEGDEVVGTVASFLDQDPFGPRGGF